MAKYDPSLDACFTALGDPTRRGILERLARGPATVSELAAPHDMALPSFMGHLRKLEAAGLIATQKEGRSRICRLSPEAFAPVHSWLSEQRALWEGRLDRFDAYVTTLTTDETP
ncbi:ArsR/SmtB family transcription factor [Pseudoruegeria sp. SHC-113]|uniref:ArsR/SmtB family transcription factor n=1 Tax=Pseudoruegeria sp. SHC-113 TaxID=2855439 RepID=UPI0021BB1FEC|nr:metalloregulator ArsR/SmtB family transcription factor [Pseudoruegeria sp. SHC-113]MCT8161827.1 metalloregulator ArsR/SmtB family transcription factor [Pseudoruegeria sp. SHC-113]